MIYADYETKRKTLTDAMDAIVKGDKFDSEAFAAKKKEVEALDAEWEAFAKAKADMDAMNDIAPDIKPVISLEKGEPIDKIDKKPVDVYASEDYRYAFMAHVQSGVPLPEQYTPLNANANTTTSDAGAVIPTTIVDNIIREMKSRGNVWAKVRKTNLQGGVDYPISDIIPKATWITEPQTSDDQKLSAKTSVSFNYYGLECKISQSLLVSIVTLQSFEDMFAQVATEAIIAALEIGVFNGTGTGQMTGLTVDSRIPEGNVIELTAADIAKWDTWKKKVFAKMKKAYRNGDFFMAQSTFDGYIDGMVDSNGQPIGRVNYGIDGGENYRFGGKTVETVEDDVIKSWDDAAAGEIFAVFADLTNYAINTNMQMTTVKWIDHDSNLIKNKLILICDGKVLDPNGVLILKKKTA